MSVLRLYRTSVSERPTPAHPFSLHRNPNARRLSLNIRLDRQSFDCDWLYVCLSGLANRTILTLEIWFLVDVHIDNGSVVEHGPGCDGCVLHVTQPSGNKGITEEMLKQLLPICRRIDRFLSRIRVLFYVDVGVFLCPCTDLDLSIWYGATGKWFPGFQHRGVSIDRDRWWVVFNG